MGSWPGYEPGMLRYLFLWEEVNYSQTEISISYVTKQADKLLYYPLYPLCYLAKLLSADFYFICGIQEHIEWI